MPAPNPETWRVCHACRAGRHGWYCGRQVRSSATGEVNWCGCCGPENDKGDAK